MARLKRKDLKHDEFVEGFVDFGHWLEHNWRTVARWAGAVAGVGIVLGIGFAYVSYNRGKAVELLRQGTASFQRSAESQFADTDELGAALQSFERAADKAGGSPTGRLARFYRAVALYRMGRTEESIGELESYVDGADPGSTLTWSAQSLLGTLLVSEGQVERALDHFKGLAESTEEGYPAHQALLEVGRLYQSQGNTDEARKQWERIVAEHAQSFSAQEAQRLLGSF
jgi:TolA-binding protein